VEEWLHHRSAHYAWWRKPVTQDAQFDRACCPKEIEKTNHLAVKDRPKRQRCILWFEFSGRPFNGLAKSSTPTAELRKHSIRIDQQPLGGATAIVFAADLHIGGKPVTLSSKPAQSHLISWRFQYLYQYSIVLFGLGQHPLHLALASSIELQLQLILTTVHMPFGFDF